MIVRTGPGRGVRGCAELDFARDGSRTILTRSRVEAPMAIVRPFPLPDGGLSIQLVSLGPGICGGDVIRVSVRARAGARVVVTTTAATRLMAVDEDVWAQQQIALEADDGAVLEYYPCVTIPYPGSAFHQTITARATRGGRIGMLECWAMGRIARSEYLRFRSLASRTTLTVDGALTYADAIRVVPEEADLAGAGVLAGRRYLAAGCWSGVTLPDDRSDDPPGNSADPVLAFAQSSPDLVYLRGLGHDGPAMEAALRRSVERVAQGWGLAPVGLDRFHN